MSYISTQVRRLVYDRAAGCCEYCLISQQDRLIPFEIDHIIAIKFEGTSEPDNLCLSCNQCNEFKGTNVAAPDPHTKQPTFLFHPRQHQWSDHFRLNGPLIDPLTPEGRATVLVLRLNIAERVAERELLLQIGSYPCAQA